MQAIEITILLVVAVVAAGIITLFLFSFDFAKFQESVFRLLTGEGKETNLEKIPFPVFLDRLSDCWQTCLAQNPADANATDCGAAYLESLPNASVNLDSAFLLDQFRTVNYCGDCNVVVEPQAGIGIPAVLSMHCIPNSLHPFVRVQ
ncbi:MAG: hypothetical protein V1777_04045 [Candidatus Micrarchaeota archaeon]